MSTFTRKRNRQAYTSEQLEKNMKALQKKYFNNHAEGAQKLTAKLEGILTKMKTDYKFSNDLKGKEALLNKLQKNYNFQNVRALSFEYRNQLPVLINMQKKQMKGLTNAATVINTNVTKISNAINRTNQALQQPSPAAAQQAVAAANQAAIAANAVVNQMQNIKKMAMNANTLAKNANTLAKRIQSMSGGKRNTRRN